MCLNTDTRPQFVSDLLPNVNGLFLGNDTRRWDYLLRKLAEGEEPWNDLDYPDNLLDGRLWYADIDKHAYIDDPLIGSKQVALSGEPQPPLTHGNEAHDPTLLAYFLPMESYYNANDITVGVNPTAIASISASSNRWNIPFAGLNFRPDTGNTANRTLYVWFEAGNPAAQKTAKYPVNVVLNETKRPLFYGLAARNVGDLGFWQAKGMQAPTIYLKAQTDSESAIVSDTYLMNLQVGPA